MEVRERPYQHQKRNGLSRVTHLKPELPTKLLRAAGPYHLTCKNRQVPRQRPSIVLISYKAGRRRSTIAGWL